MTGAALGVTAAAASAITFDEIVDLEHQVDIAYRIGARFMLADSTVQVLRKLKDSEGRYLWQQSHVAGVPGLLFNYPYVVNNDMATITNSAKTVLFGQLSKYKIRDVAGIRLRRLTELYAANDQEGFVLFVRSDGNLLNAGGGPVKYLQQAA